VSGSIPTRTLLIGTLLTLWISIIIVFGLIGIIEQTGWMLAAVGGIILKAFGGGRIRTKNMTIDKVKRTTTGIINLIYLLSHIIVP
jgi:hypothetical protein